MTEPGSASRSLEGMLAALRMNLSALSYLALFVSLFLVHARQGSALPNTSAVSLSLARE